MPRIGKRKEGRYDAKGLDGRRAWLIVVIALAWLHSHTRQGYADWTGKRQAMRNSKAFTDDLIERPRNK